MTELSDDVILLRPIHADDVEQYIQLQDSEMADRFEWARRADQTTVEDAVARWTRSWMLGGPERNFAIVTADGAEMIGNCEVELRADGAVNVMYVVFRPWRRKGFASRAVALLTDYAAVAFPGHELLFRIHPDNVASVAVAESTGAVRYGTERSRTGRELGTWILDHSDPDEADFTRF